MLLESVSRSFYLTIRALPKALRQPIRTAYLLARATDTIADTSSIPMLDRLRHLRLLRSIILGEKPLEDSARMGIEVAPLQSNSAEKILLTHLVEILADYQSLEPADHADVRWVLDQITIGQEEDLLTPRLADAAALERYTWLVAGCVGEFWTRLGLRKLKHYATLPDAEMIQLGADFGKGLQLVNILRDYPEDEKNGRSYIPSDYDQWRQRANILLENGWRYVLALRWWRLRFACALPVLIGLRTLAMLGTTPPQNRIKVPRKEIRAMLVQVACRAISRRALANYGRQFLLKTL
ncbi:MAG: squalene/phytoene synthase family protein [Chthoniobacterales bacterium]